MRGQYSAGDMARFREMMSQVGEQDIRDPARYMEILDSRLGLGEEALEDAGYGEGPGNRARSMSDIVTAMAYARYGITDKQLENMNPDFVMGLMAGAAIRDDMKSMFGFQDKKQPPRLVQGVRDFCKSTRELIDREREARDARKSFVAEVDVDGEKRPIHTHGFFKRWYADASAQVAAGFSRGREFLSQARTDAGLIAKAGAEHVKARVLEKRDAAQGKINDARDYVAAQADRARAGGRKLLAGAETAAGYAAGVIAETAHGAAAKAADMRDKAVSAGRRGFAVAASLRDLMPRVTFSKGSKSLAEWAESARAILSGDRPEAGPVNVFDSVETVRLADRTANADAELRRGIRGRDSHELDGVMNSVAANGRAAAEMNGAELEGY